MARHFGDELMAIVQQNPDPTHCVQCEYKTTTPKNLSIHVALVHGKLDEFLANEDLVQEKKEAVALTKKVDLGKACPICGVTTVKQIRDHIASHYMDELKMIVSEFPDPTKCPQCPYTAKGNKMEAGMLKHVALGHSMLDALLRDEKLLKEKKENYTPIKPKKVIDDCPICGFEKASRDHVARHFGQGLATNSIFFCLLFVKK